MLEMDVDRTQLLVNTIIAASAIVGVAVSLVVVFLHLRHQRRLEIKRVQEDYLREFLRLLDRPLDLALSNISEVDYLRAASPADVATGEALHRARPMLMANMRNAYQDFTNIASTITTVLPACRKRLGIGLDSDRPYGDFYKPLIELVEAYEQLTSRYGNAAELVKANVDTFLNDNRQKHAQDLVVRVRYFASHLLAELYA